jgi:hypothetical protein
MARSHGRISAAIWRDQDFIALEAEPQRLYLFVLSQPDLTHAGLIPLRTRLWSTRFNGGTPGRVRTALEALEEQRFILVDEDTEELLVRTFVRNDGVYKQPKVMERMAIDAGQIMSSALRAAFCVELRRLPYDDLTGHQRETAERVRDELLSLFGEPIQPPPDPSGTLPDTHGDTHGEGLAEPSFAHVRAAPVPRPPTPVPLPPASLGVVCRLTSVDVSATTTDDAIAEWQTLAGRADLQTEATRFLLHNANVELKNPAAAWRGWLRKACTRESKRVLDSERPDCADCGGTGWGEDDEQGRAVKCHCRNELSLEAS